jgi:hypothetical protein
MVFVFGNRKAWVCSNWNWNWTRTLGESQVAVAGRGRASWLAGLCMCMGHVALCIVAVVIVREFGVLGCGHICILVVLLFDLWVACACVWVCGGCVSGWARGCG